MPAYPLVAIRSFIEATRDSGYKSTSSAIAELVDNSFEADATIVDVVIVGEENGAKRVSVTDNGTGMPASSRLFPIPATSTIIRTETSRTS